MFNNAIRRWRQEHGDWPDSLSDVLHLVAGPDSANVMTNPLTGDNPGYAYQKPLEESDAEKTIVVYPLLEGEPDMTFYVLFANGKVERGPRAAESKVLRPVT